MDIRTFQFIISTQASYEPEFVCIEIMLHLLAKGPNISSGGSRISRRGGGVDLVGGAVDPRGGYVSKILHVKTKESGPIGGGARAGRPPPLDPPMIRYGLNANKLRSVDSRLLK